MLEPQKNLILDTHVHIYDCYDLPTLFKHAYANLSRYLPQPQNVKRGIILTERSSEHYFESLLNGKVSGPFSVKVVDETCLSINSEDFELLVFAARQIKCSEGLEIHVIGSHEKFNDNQNFLATIKQLLQRDLTLVIPWGFAKWLGMRAQLIQKVSKDFPVLLGDSLMRPAWWRNMLLDDPDNHKIIRGSDPLPWPGQENLAGQYATIFDLADSSGSYSLQLCTALKGKIRNLGRRTLIRDTNRALRSLVRVNYKKSLPK